MDFFSKIFPLFSCALAVGICWYREANSAVVKMVTSASKGSSKTTSEME